MEMTIDEAIYCMESYLPSDNYTHCTECKYHGKTCASITAHQKAINTMRKYQKIEQALNSWNMNCINDREFINTIREVTNRRWE